MAGGGSGGGSTGAGGGGGGLRYIAAHPVTPANCTLLPLELVVHSHHNKLEGTMERTVCLEALQLSEEVEEMPPVVLINLMLRMEAAAGVVVFMEEGWELLEQGY